MNNNNLYTNNNFLGTTHLDASKITSNFILATSNILEQHISVSNLNNSNFTLATSNILETHSSNFTNKLRTDVNKWINEEKEHITFPITTDLTHTYIYNSNLAGEIRFWTKSTYLFPPQIPGDYPEHRVKIDPDGKLKLYYTYDSSINATWLNGWVDIINLVISLVASDVNTGISIAGIEIQIKTLNDKIDFQIAGVYNALAAIEAGDLGQDIESLQEYQETLENAYNNFQAENTLGETYTNIRNLISSRNTSYIARIQTNITNLILQNPATVFFTGSGGVALGIIYGIAQNVSFNNYLNSLTKSIDKNSNLTQQEKQNLKDNITSNLKFEVDVKKAELQYNLGLVQGFINSNITTTQTIRTLATETLYVNSGNINGIDINNLKTSGNIIENGATLSSKYITSNQIYNLTNNYTTERQYPPKLYTTIQTEDTATLLSKLVYHQSLYLDNQSISYGAGFYELYSSSTYDTPTTKNRLFNYNTAETTTLARWAINQYSSGTGDYISGNFIVSGYYGDWIIIKMPQSIMLTRYRIYQRTDFLTKAPSLWKCYGSTDGITFYEITEASQTTRLTSYTNGYYEKTIATNVPLYNYIGFVFSSLLSVSGATDLSFSELQLFGKEVVNQTVVSNIYTTSNVCKNLIIYDTPQVSKHFAFYCQTTTPIYINGGNTQYYKYDIDMTNYTTTGYIQIGSGSNDPYRIFRIRAFFGSCYFSKITNGLPDILHYEIYMSSKAAAGGSGTTAGINIFAVGYPNNSSLNVIPPNNLFILSNPSNNFNYITLVSTSPGDIRCVIEDLLS
jgi:hypothetical protein